MCENKVWNDPFTEQYLVCKCLLNKAVILQGAKKREVIMTFKIVPYWCFMEKLKVVQITLRPVFPLFFKYFCQL